MSASSPLGGSWRAGRVSTTARRSRFTPAPPAAEAPGRSGALVPPVAQDPVELAAVEGEEAAGLLKAVAGRGVRADGLDAVLQVLLPAEDHGLAAGGHLVPGVTGDL